MQTSLDFKELKKDIYLTPYTLKNLGKLALSKVPFNIIYTIAHSVIVILAVWHKKREERWKMR